jgi:hypothetical protein
MSEVELANLAQEKSTDPKIKDFAVCCRTPAAKVRL